MADGSETDSPYDFAPKEPAPPAPPRKPGSRREAPRPVEREVAPEPLPDLAPRAPEPQPAPSAPEVSDEPVIERTCPHCGFRIIGKPRGGRCPECAAALDEVATDLLQFSDGGWLVGMSNGALILGGAVVLQAAAIVVVWTGEVWFGNSLHALAAVVIAAGVWMATASEPRVGTGRTPLAPLARMMAIAVAGLWVASMFAQKAPAVGGRSQALIMIILTATALLAAFVGLHLRSLAVRVPNDSLAAHLQNSSILLAGTCLLMVGLHALGLADAAHLMFFFCAFPMIGGMVVVIVWSVWSLVRMAMELRNCAMAGHTIVARQALRAQAAADQAARR